MPFLEREFLFTSGKGGVGKTTVAVALGRALAARGRRVLVGLLDASLGARLLGVETLTSGHMQPCAERLWATLIEPEAAIAEYATMILKSPTAYRALLENRYARSFFTAVPGLYQWAVLGKAWYHSQEHTAAGTRRFDTVILDAPATGHGLEMLRVPKLILEVAPVGVLRRDAELAWQTLTDAKRAGVVVVSIPEELAVSETLELVSKLGELKVPVAAVVLNAVHERLFNAEERESLTDLGERLGAPAKRLVQVGLERLLREDAEAKQMGRLAALAESLVKLPWVEGAATEPGVRPLVGALADALTAA
jgi:anion-transporting  ArsA/GET3 family ATPase